MGMRKCVCRSLTRPTRRTGPDTPGKDGVLIEKQAARWRTPGKSRPARTGTASWFLSACEVQFWCLRAISGRHPRRCQRRLVHIMSNRATDPAMKSVGTKDHRLRLVIPLPDENSQCVMASGAPSFTEMPSHWRTLHGGTAFDRAGPLLATPAGTRGDVRKSGGDRFPTTRRHERCAASRP